MSMDSFLVVVADDHDGKPGEPKAFITRPGQGVNYHTNIWHGALAPLAEPALFAIIDRIGKGENLELHHFEKPYTVVQNS